MVAIGISDALDVLGKIPCRQTMQPSASEQNELEIDAFRGRETSDPW